jgi:hypothetical protein
MAILRKDFDHNVEARFICYVKGCFAALRWTCLDSTDKNKRQESDYWRFSHRLLLGSFMLSKKPNWSSGSKPRAGAAERVERAVLPTDLAHQRNPVSDPRHSQTNRSSKAK